jgi:hypothetical protein
MKFQSIISGAMNQPATGIIHNNLGMTIDPDFPKNHQPVENTR